MMETRETLLACTICRGQKSFNLTMAQVRQLSEGKQLQFHCRFCGCPQYWKPTGPVEVSETAGHPAAEPKNILVVDDDDLTLKLLKKVLETWDAQIEVAQNGKDALSKLSSGNFDLMICDINMPEMNGPQLFQQVQDNALLPAQRIIFLTGDKSGPIRKFLDSSGCYFIYKPISFLEFSEQVQEVLSGRVPS